MNQKLREYLIEVAKRGCTTSYREAVPYAGVANPQGLAKLLDDINQYEDSRSGCLLSAVVTRDPRTGDGMPGTGFWKSAWKLGRQVGEDHEQFWRDELERVWAYSWE